MTKQNIILIVDDIPKNIQLVAQHLKPLGHKLLFATSGQKALDMLKENSVDLVLLDIMMPDMNGFETCRQIKKEPEYSLVPIIFITARNEVTDIVEGFDAGGSDYITKPFHGQELLERVKTHLELKIHRDQLQIKQQQLQDLVHILSHDLRNNLSGITMTIDLAKLEGKSLNDYEDRLREMSDSGLEIIDLVKTMLSMDEKPFVLRTVSLEESLSRSLEILEPQLEAKQITVRKPEKISCNVLAEPTSLVNSVLNNILTNAIKFSEENSILEFKICRRNQWIDLTLRDYGVGIPPEIQENLFDLHKAVSRPGTKGEKGSGYGLPLVKKFMTAYGGTLSVRSDINGKKDFARGTMISLIFPEGV